MEAQLIIIDSLEQIYKILEEMEEYSEGSRNIVKKISQKLLLDGDLSVIDSNIVMDLLNEATVVNNKIFDIFRKTRSIINPLLIVDKNSIETLDFGQIE